MEPAIKNVIVLGASGNMGPYVLSSLKEFGFHISVVTRPSSSVSFPPDVTVHKILLIAAIDVAIQKKVIDAAVTAGVRRFLPSEYGGDTSLPEIEKFTAFAGGKKEVLAYLKSKEVNGLAWTAIYTGPFFDWLLNTGRGLMGWELEKSKATVFDSGDRRVDWTNVTTIGRAIASVLKHLEVTRNQQVFINSFQLTQNQVVAAIERLLGKKLDISRASAIELTEKGRLTMAQGDWENGYYNSATGSTYAPWGFCDFGGRPVRWNAVLELPKEDLDVTLTQVLQNKGLI
ncbi:NmrA-like family protein [Xylogone sp. PMI_703]|nr:NmrA-like family protein [Xylogone sp. PMI_703]